MKKILIFITILLIPINVSAISAEAYIVMDMDSGRILEGDNINKKMLIASISNLMTTRKKQRNSYVIRNIPIKKHKKQDIV